MMVRVCCLLVLTVALVLSGGSAQAQYGYGWGGWGGWGGGASTVQGDIARGAGRLAAGAGVYNETTAVANSINADTVMRYNQYMFQAQQEANQRQYVRQARRIGKTNTTAAATADRLRNRPEQGDIDRGDALNVLLDDLTSPSLLHASGLRFADSSIDAALVREIPFRNAAEAVTICLDQLVDRQQFPTLLQSKALAAESDAFITATHEAARQAREQGEISPETIKAVQTTGRALYEKAKSPQVAATAAERTEALDYLKGMSALARIVENPETLQRLRELKKVQTTHVANLVAFMHTYNLRFGPAETPEQRNAYRKLYPILKADRDKVYSAANVTSNVPPPPPNPKLSPIELFQGLDEKQLDLPAQAK